MHDRQQGEFTNEMLGVKGLKDANTYSSLLAYVGGVFCVVHIGSATALCIG